MESAASDCKNFVRRSEFRGTLRQLQQFHEDPRALQRLTPPMFPVRIVQDRRRGLTEGEVELLMGPGPFAIRWVARHEPGPTAHSFADRMLEGPLALWEHQHIFEPLVQGVALTDRIKLAHHAGWRGLLTRLLFDGPALRLLFSYRHWRTRRALEARS